MAIFTHLLIAHIILKKPLMFCPKDLILPENDVMFASTKTLVDSRLYSCCFLHLMPQTVASIIFQSVLLTLLL